MLQSNLCLPFDADSTIEDNKHQYREVVATAHQIHDHMVAWVGKLLVRFMFDINW
jgi:hypothetical protein